MSRHALFQVFENKNENKDVRSRTVWAIGRIGSVDESVILSFIKTLENKSEDYDVRWFTAWALGRIGSAAASAVPTLTNTIKEENNITYGRTAIDLGGYFDVQDENALAALHEVYEVPGKEFWEARNELRTAAEYALNRISAESDKSVK
ncbi:MAG: HEAT repeat domain-containing protein [Crinalium sp.]